MNILTTAIALLSLSLSTSILACEGHGHDHNYENDDLNYELYKQNYSNEYEYPDVDKSVIRTNANKIISSLVKSKKIHNSWGKINPKSIITTVFNGQNEWLVTYHNPKLPNVKEHKLFLFLTMKGKYIAINYTGI